MKKEVKRTLIALLPLAVLVVLLALDIAIFGADSILGASQVALLTAAGTAIGLGICHRAGNRAVQDSLEQF